MKDSIYTIPINEVFEPKCGCPICAMRDTLEERCVEYIMGAAMMEPDVRMETNRLGFCKAHFDQMMKRKNRLSLALMLESHLKEIQEKGLKAGTAGASGGLFKKAKAQSQEQTCFVCKQIDWAVERMLDTVMKMYGQHEEFRKLYAEQAFVCLPHFQLLTAYAAGHLDKKVQKAFLADTEVLCRKYLDEVAGDVSHYCQMFDYRNNGADADWGNSKDSIERAIYFLTSRRVE